MAARPDLPDRIHGLTVRSHVHAFAKPLLHAQLVYVHHEFLVAGYQPALEPAGRMQHEIRAREHRRVQRIRAFIGGLRIRDLGGAKRSAGAERQPEPARKLCRAIGDERGLRRPEGRRARLHRDGGGESAEEHRRAGAHELREGRASQYLGEDLRQRPGHRHRAHRPGKDEGRDDRGLIVAGIDLGRAEHGLVIDHGRIGVDQAGQDRVLRDEIVTEQDTDHGQGILRPLRRGDGAHEGLVRIFDMGIDHVEVTLVHRHVDRLADGAPGMVDRRRHIGELHEILEIPKRCIAALAVEIAHEGRAVDRGKDHRLAADLNRSFRIARVLGIDRWRGLQKRPAKPLGEMDMLATHFGTGLFPHGQRLRIAEDDADLLENGIGIAFDDRERLFVQHLERGEPAVDIGLLHARPCAPARAASRRGTTAGPAPSPPGRRITPACGFVAHGPRPRFKNWRPPLARLGEW